jgi:hypothetical protein
MASMVFFIRSSIIDVVNGFATDMKKPTIARTTNQLTMLLANADITVPTEAMKIDG